MRLELAGLCLLLGGCASIHTYDAARDLNPASIVSVSTSVGTTVDERDRNGDGVVNPKDHGFKQEKVFVPDAKADVRVKLNDIASIVVDPLPPAIGGGMVFHWVIPAQGAPALTLAPTISYLVFPRQNVYSVEVPLALSRKFGNHLVLYAGPKYLFQSRALEKESGFQGLILAGVHDRPDNDLSPTKNGTGKQFGGIFGGFSFGWTHLQISPEVIYYKSLDDGERVIQVGSQVRVAL